MTHILTCDGMKSIKANIFLNGCLLNLHAFLLGMPYVDRLLFVENACGIFSLLLPVPISPRRRSPFGRVAVTC